MKNINGLLVKLKELDEFDIEIRTPYQKCSSCDKIKGDVELCIEPFKADIHDVHEWTFLCESCYKEHCNDI